MTEISRGRTIRWETVAVTVLPPGWTNVYEDERGDEVTPCPALLLQEARAYSRVTATGTEETALEPPYETRVVFADFEGGELTPAKEAGNYKTTNAPLDMGLE